MLSRKKPFDFLSIRRAKRGDQSSDGFKIRYSGFYLKNFKNNLWESTRIPFLLSDCPYKGRYLKKTRQVGPVIVPLVGSKLVDSIAFTFHFLFIIVEAWCLK